MPATLKSLTAKTRKIDIAIDDDPKAITIEYTPRGYTARIERQVKEAMESELASAMMIPMVLSMVTKWNLSPAPGDPPIPLTPEGLEDVPTEILGLIVETIGEEMSPKAETPSE